MLGPKMAHAADVNFGILVTEIAARAPAALRGKGTRGFLNKTGDWRYDSIVDLERLPLSGRGHARVGRVSATIAALSDTPIDAVWLIIAIN